MNEQQIRSAINDCNEVMGEASRAINDTAPANENHSRKIVADASNRVAIATALGAKALLGVQLESVILRDTMGKAYADGGVPDPSKINEALTKEN